MERYDHVFLPLFMSCLSLFFFSIIASASLLPLDRNQMDTMRNLSSSVSKWKSGNQNPCLWNGVTCSNSSATSSVVTQLDLSGLGLHFDDSSATLAVRFFQLLCELNSLESLDLSGNAFNSIPELFFSNCSGLSGLKFLNLSSNRLLGPLQDFSGFRSLETLNLAYNFLNGTITSQLDGLTGLKRLNLSFNRVTGAIPDSMALSLDELALSVNKFDRQIPERIFLCENLTLLDFSQNYLSGPLPEDIGKLSKLKTLLLSSNRFTGEIPGSLSKIGTLSRFAANQNSLTGSIPDGITNSVENLDLSYNRLTGNMPRDLLSPPTLKSVDLSNNSLRGHISGNLSKGLYRLRLGQNSLDGNISNEIGQLQNLAYLELDGNQLSGEIPPEIGNCKNLTLLNLGSNRLQGGLPKELGTLKQLVVLKLDGNDISGEIPIELYKLANLSIMNMSLNLLSGQISSEISNLQKLTNLYLQGNNFTGSLPDMSDMSSLIELQMGNNKLGGAIPTMPGKLEFLNLSSNYFDGSIPPSIGSLSQLEVLDLSNNYLTGLVPDSLTKIESLTVLNLSNNKLSGHLPSFPPYVKVIATGNKDLNNTEAGKSSSKTKSHILIPVVSTIGALVLLGLGTAVVMFIISKRLYRVEDEGPSCENNLPQIINGSFVTTNSIHRSTIDFSKTIEAVGNPGNIVLKTRFSTYYKAVMPNGACYMIKKLNTSEKVFQIGSLERFGQELEVLGRLSNSNIMVPLAYVLTEDNAYLLYEDVHKGTLFDFLHKDPGNDLDWQSLYSIALGIAQGLTFLHGCVQPVLLLDLSTRSIHLKSPKEPQIGDIELCKVIDPSKSTGSISTIAGSVGYIPPEYAYTMRVTAAGNVYSFGVILLELLTGKPPVSGGTELAKWALALSTRIHEREQILDPRISKTSLAVRSQMLLVLKVALACVNASAEARPKMRNVLRMLFNAK